MAEAGAVLQARFDRVLGGLGDVPVVQAMAHAARGGNRLRGFLVLEGARLHGIAAEAATWAATGIEALHDETLKLLNKGASAAINIQLLKWTRLYGERGD